MSDILTNWISPSINSHISNRKNTLLEKQYTAANARCPREAQCRLKWLGAIITTCKHLHSVIYTCNIVWNSKGDIKKLCFIQKIKYKINQSALNPWVNLKSDVEKKMSSKQGFVIWDDFLITYYLFYRVIRNILDPSGNGRQ